MSFIRLGIIALLPLVGGLIVFLLVGDLTETLIPFSSDDPFIWSWIKGIGPASFASYLAYDGIKRTLVKLGLKE